LPDCGKIGLSDTELVCVYWFDGDDKLTGFDWSEKKRKELTWPLSNLVSAVLARV